VGLIDTGIGDFGVDGAEQVDRMGTKWNPAGAAMMFNVSQLL
jgi:hypothetical protein